LIAGSAVFDWRVLAAAACVVLAVGSSVWWVVRSGADDNSQQRATSERPPVATPSVEAAVTQSASWASLPGAPDVRLPADLVLTTRGVNPDRDAFLKVFGEAIAPYTRRAVRRSRQRRWHRSRSATPMSSRCGFYLGTSRLYSGAAAEAIEPLGRARGSEVVGDDARWLQAVALQRAGRESEARTALRFFARKPVPTGIGHAPWSRREKGTCHIFTVT
jgi:hypothetical protein